MNRLLLLFLIFLFYWPAHSLEISWLKVVTRSGETVEGERLYSYNNRWFWEKDLDQRVLGLYVPDAEPSLKLRFFSREEIIVMSKRTLNYSPYQQFLVEQDLLLQKSPLEGRVFVSTGPDGHHRAENMFGDFALDLEKRLDGRTYENKGGNNSDFHVWGAEVRSPVSGTVVDFTDKAIDNIPDPRLQSSLQEKGDGNFVLLRLQGDFYFLVLHMQEGSLPPLEVGQQIRVGDFLGKVGNSGKSYVPHLHMTTYFYSRDFNRMISVPNFFKTIQHQRMGYPETNVRDVFYPKGGDSITSISEPLETRFHCSKIYR